MSSGPWVLSIDFGTSYTVVASRIHGQAAEVIEIDGERRVPSVVMITDDFGVVIGRAADEMAAAAPSRVLRSPKSRLGDPAPIILGGRPFQATSLVAEVLAKVYDEAVRHHGSTPESTRLTYPASWSGHRRQQLLRAAELAGLGAVTLVPEPVAAAIAYADHAATPAGTTVLVYDLGGGTVDCAVLRTTAAGFELIGRPGGDRQLGGELFDELLANMIGERLPADVWEQLQLADDTSWRQAWVGLRREARRAKELLSTQQTVDILVALPTGIRELRVTRAEVDSVIGPFVADSVQILRDTAADAGVTEADIAAIYLVGGGSRMPLVETLVAEAFPNTLISRRGDPKAAVALGGTHPAAIAPQAALVQQADQVTDPHGGPAAAAAPQTASDAAHSVAGAPPTRLLANWASPAAVRAEAATNRRRVFVGVGIVVAIIVAGVAWVAARDDPSTTVASPSASTADTAVDTVVDTAMVSTSPAATDPTDVVTTTTDASTTTSVATATTTAPTDHLLAVVSAAATATSFVRILQASGLAGVMAEQAGLTVFVPTEAGLAAAFAGTNVTVEAVIASPAAALALVAQSIVVDPTLTTSSDGVYTTLAGTTITVRAATVDGIAFGGQAWRGTNGNAWPIDGVLLPAGFSIPSGSGSTAGPATPTTTKRPGGAAAPPTQTSTAPSAPSTPATTAPVVTASGADPTVPPTTAASSGPVPAGLEGGDPSTVIAQIKQAGFQNVVSTLVSGCSVDMAGRVASYGPQGTQPFAKQITVNICP